MQTVESVLRHSQGRIRERRERIYGISQDELRSQIGLLRTVMFKRRKGDEAFWPLSNEELGVLEHFIREYKKSGQFVTGNECFMASAYETIRHNLLCGTPDVSPEQFRSASAKITEALMIWAGGRIGVDIWDSDVTVMIPWRAGLAFADAAIDAGFSKFYHFGARRNELTLETEVYFEDIPESLFQYPGERMVVLADCMLASGNTIIAALRRLGEIGIAQERTLVLSVVSAPEGVDHILQEYPRVRIFSGKHDECLNRTGYIIPGLGDYGNWFFEGLSREKVAAWQDKGILSPCAAKALLARMARN